MKRSELVTVALALASLLFAAWTGYSSNDKTMAQRISTLETQQRNDTAAIIRVETKLDRLIEWTRGRP